MRTSEMLNKKFGNLLVVKRIEDSKTGIPRFRCSCDCGGYAETTGYALRSGNTKSCGCFQKQRASESSKTHGLSKTVEYRAWIDLLKRCCDPDSQMYSHYGGRGIVVCDRWLNGFENFLADMGKRPDGMEIDRINNNGNYEPENCRWTTRIVNTNNKRNNVLITFKNETKTASEWSRVVGLSAKAIAMRITKYKWTPERALTQPLQSNIRH